MRTSMDVHGSPSPDQVRVGGGVRELAAVTLLAVAVTALYLGNGTTLGSGDTLPARQLPASILTDGDFYLDEYVSHYDDKGRHSIVEVDGHWLSNYPVGAALLALPFYVPSALAGLHPDDASLEVLEKVAATGIVVLSALVMYGTLRRLSSLRASLAVTAVYALCTSSFSTSSQALWQHGPAQLALASALYCLVRGADTPRWTAASGFPMALAVLCRPANLLMVVPLALFVLVRQPRRFPLVVVAALPVGAFALWYNLGHFGAVFHSQFSVGSPELWSTPLLQGVAGLLLSPGRGLFLYSPIILLSVGGFASAWRNRADAGVVPSLLRFSSPGVVAVVLLHGRWWSWWGGLCYGPRLLADTLPVLCLALVPVVGWVAARPLRRVLVACLAAWSFLAHFSGAYWDDGRWTGYDLPGGLWSWRDSPLTNPPRELVNAVIIGLGRLPTTHGDPSGARCSYLEEASTDRVVGRVNQEVRVDVVARNSGRVVWRAWPKRHRGSVQLLWQLAAPGAHGAVERSGAAPLRHSVFPGDSHRFSVAVSLPRAPGTYELSFDVAARKGARCSDLGIPVLRVPVEVRPRRGRGLAATGALSSPEPPAQGRTER